MTLLHYLAWSSKTPSETFEKYHKLSNFDIRTVEKEGRSVLHFAAQRGNRRIIEYLFRAGVEIDGKDHKGKTALHYAIENKRACGTIEILLSHGANLRAKDHQGRSALHLAAKLNNLAAIEALLTAGMADDLHIADYNGMTPVQLASTNRATASLAFLADMGNSSVKNEISNATEWNNTSQAASHSGEQDISISSSHIISTPSHGIMLTHDDVVQAVIIVKSPIGLADVLFRRLHHIFLRTWHVRKRLIEISMMVFFSWLIVSSFKI